MDQKAYNQSWCKDKEKERTAVLVKTGEQKAVKVLCVPERSESSCT